MYCRNCGTQIPAGTKFCAECGMRVERILPGGDAAVKREALKPGTEPPIPERSAAREAWSDNRGLQQDPSLPEGIFRDAAGAYHWRYGLDMKRNPVPMFTIMKIFFFIDLFMGTLLFVTMLANGSSLRDALINFAVPVVGINGFFCILTLIAWGILFRRKGGVQVFEYLMTEHQVVTLETEEDRKLSSQIGTAAFVLGMLGDSQGAAAAGVAVAVGGTFVSEYGKVRAVIARPRQDLIKVNNILQRNTIYALPHQYEFVWNYITERCHSAKIRR